MQEQKQRSQRISTLNGMHMDDNDEHLKKAPSSICNRKELGSNTTKDSLRQEQKQRS
jgi:hypothetical protein